MKCLVVFVIRVVLYSDHRLLKGFIAGCGEHTHDFSGGRRVSESLQIPQSAMASAGSLVLVSSSLETVGVWLFPEGLENL